jgi:hypothetical protein
MCECGGTGTIEVYTFSIGLRETACPDDDCAYWSGE